jgi:Flp pilus assembly protein TadB
MASGFEMRVSDAEREATAAELREHYASGRLTLDELNERIDQAFAARTRGDLDALMRDLPSARPGGTGFTGARPGGAGTGPTGPAWGGAEPTWAAAGRRAGGTIRAAVVMFVAMSALLLFGVLAVFGLGPGRPIGVVLLLAGLALLRRLIFGRRRRMGACGPRRRRW